MQHDTPGNPFHLIRLVLLPRKNLNLDSHTLVTWDIVTFDELEGGWISFESVLLPESFGPGAAFHSKMM